MLTLACPPAHARVCPHPFCPSVLPSSCTFAYNGTDAGATIWVEEWDFETCCDGVRAMDEQGAFLNTR